MGAHGEVKKIWKENENYLLPQVMILGARENNGEQAWNQAMQGEVAEVLLTMEGVQVELFLASRNESGVQINLRCPRLKPEIRKIKF